MKHNRHDVKINLLCFSKWQHLMLSKSFSERPKMILQILYLTCVAIVTVYAQGIKRRRGEWIIQLYFPSIYHHLNKNFLHTFLEKACRVTSRAYPTSTEQFQSSACIISHSEFDILEYFFFFFEGEIILFFLPLNVLHKLLYGVLRTFCLLIFILRRFFWRIIIYIHIKVLSKRDRY